MYKQSIEVWDGANVSGPDKVKTRDIYCPLMGGPEEIMNYWSSSCESRQEESGWDCPKTCPRNKLKMDKPQLW